MQKEEQNITYVVFLPKNVQPASNNEEATKKENLDCKTILDSSKMSSTQKRKKGRRTTLD